MFLRGTAVLPLSIVRRLGRRFGRIAYYLLPRVQSIGMKNLNLAYGDSITAKEKKAILMQSMENLGILAAEFTHLPMLQSDNKESLFEIKGLEYLDASRGGFMIGAHLGNWEWMAGAIGNLDYKKVGVVRPLRDPRLNDAIEKLRGATGIKIIGKKNTGAELIKAVRDGHIAGLLIDQSTRKNGIPVTFFGQPCWATVGPVMVAIRTRTPLYPLSMIRGETGIYTLEIHPPITIERTGSIHQDLINGSQACQDVIEVMVRKNPGQWMWIHNRWKERPNLQREWDKRLKKP